MPGRFAAGWRLLPVLAVLCCSMTLPAAPRPLSRAESEAVRFVAAHLANGPSALWDSSSANSKFHRLGRAEGTNEIELRVGPREGAEWELLTVGRNLADSMAAFRVTFPSGADDTIIMTLQNENGVWKISDIRSMSDPVAAASGPSKRSVTPVRTKSKVPVDLAATAAVLLLLIAATFVMRSRSRKLSLALAAAACLTFIAGGAIVYMRHARDASIDTRVTAASTLHDSPADARRMMVELRRRVAAGGEIPASEFDRAAREAEWHDRALLWSAQIAMQRNDMKGAMATLATLKQQNETPLAQILRGRIFFLQNKDVDAVMAYDRAIELGPERDDLMYEAASVLMNLGFEDRAKRYFRKLDEIGSREADAYYSLAALDVMDDDAGAAEKNLLRAFSMRPELRTALVRMGAFYELLRRPLVQAQMQMHLSAEPVVKAPHFAENPLALPPGASARCIGDYLEVDLAGARLLVSGGAALAPPTAPVLGADGWDTEDTKEAMEQVADLARVASQPSAYAQPALSRRIEETANSLVTHNRWSDLVRLTTPVTADSDLVPVNLLLMKALSQKRTGSPDAARALLESMVSRPALLKKLNAQQLLETGELLASVDSYDLAIRMMDRAAQLRDLPQLDDRVRQLLLDKRIENFASVRTPHFVIRYSEEMTPRSAEKIGEIAEAELTRLQKWVPVPNFRPVVISVISWETFRGTYTGNDHILGFYNGKITIPFAGVGYYPPEIVAILSHELAHAMIAQRTNEQAPRWFQEGLAQRIEGVEFKANPFNMYDRERMLSLAVLDASIGESADAEIVGQGYIIAQAMIRYIESRWGREGLIRFLDSFAAGSTTEEAIAKAGGGSLVAFDDAFRAWGEAKREVFQNTELVSYEENNDKIEIRRKR